MPQTQDDSQSTTSSMTAATGGRIGGTGTAGTPGTGTAGTPGTASGSAAASECDDIGPKEVTVATVWELNYIQWLPVEGKWWCKWCGDKKKGYHATKALAHFARKGKHDVAPCRGKIETECLLVYQQMWDARVAANNARTSANDAVEGRNDDHHQAVAETYQSK